MASWKWPAVLNKMLHDIPGINVLLNALLKQDVTGTTDVPAGAKRWVDTPEGKQFQVFNGQSWSSVGKLDHDAASVDGYDASPTVLKNTIPVRDANGDLPGNILGNAKTASKAAALSAVNPIEMGGTGGNTAEQARGNLGVPPTDHSSTGTDYGLGNATEYGHNKLSDATDSNLGAGGGTAATPLAVKTAKAEAITAAGKVLEAFAEGQALVDAAQDAKVSELENPIASGSTTPRPLTDRFADVVNVKDFGAKGDGMTDDTAAIQAAFVYAQKHTLAKVIFPAGTYHLGSAGVAMCGNVSIDARAAHFTRALTVGGFFTNALGITASVGGYDGNSNIEWIGGTFHGNGSANSKQFQFFSFGHARNIRVADCVFYDRCGGGHSIEVTSISGLVIENCQFLGYSKASTDGTSYQKEAIQLEHSTPNGSWMGASDYTPTTNVRISGCRFTSNPLSGLGADEVAIGGHGAIQTTDGKANVSDVVVEGCYFEGCTYAAVRPYCAERFAVSNCTFVNCHRVLKLSGVPKANVTTQSGAVATKGMACKSISFVGNRVEVTKANTGLLMIDATDTFTEDDTAAHEGLYVASNVCKKGAVDNDSVTRSICKLYRCRDVNISGNSFDYAAEIGVAVENQSAEVHIVDNVFTMLGNKGVLTADNSGVVGLYIEGNKLANDTYRGYSFAAVQLRGVSKFTIVRNDIESKLPASKTQSYTLNIASNNNGYISENSIVSENTTIQDIQVTSSNTDIKIGKNYFPKSNNPEPLNYDHGNNDGYIYSESFILSRENSSPAGIIFRNCTITGAPMLAGRALSSGGGAVTLGVADHLSGYYLSICAAHKSEDSSLPSFRPIIDQATRLGSAENRWSQLFSATAEINTSDAREKTSIADPDEALMRAWRKVNFKAFQFTDAVEKKGEDARIHFGVIAQQVQEAFASEGLDASRYALFCFDEWVDEYEDVEVVDVEAVLDENGNEVTPAVTHTEKRLVTPAGDRYGIRYSEALALECAYQRWRLDKLEAKLNAAD